MNTTELVVEIRPEKNSNPVWAWIFFWSYFNFQVVFTAAKNSCREFLLVVSMQYKADKWREQRRIVTTRFLVDPIPNSPN